MNAAAVVDAGRPVRQAAGTGREVMPGSVSVVGERQVTVRAVTVIMGAVVGLSFLFAFGNVWSLGLRLGVPVYVAPLVAPSVDLSVVGLLIATRFLSVHGASRGQLRPARRLLTFASCVTLALNVTDPLIAGEYGKAAFDSVGCWLLIGWAHVGPGLLQAMNETDRLRPTPPPVHPPGSPGASQHTTAADVGGGMCPPELTPVPRQRRAARSRADGPDVDEQLLARAKAEDARHWNLHHRPISAEALRKSLHIGATRSRGLVTQMRADARAALGGSEIAAGADHRSVSANTAVV
jgi:hypothetical protein